MELIKKSIAASLMIALGNYILLTLGNPLGPFLFAFGLLCVCELKLNLFTGKCGFYIQDKIKLTDLTVILITNLIAGYLFGLMFSYMAADLIPIAQAKVESWSVSVPFFLKSFMCGVIMYLAVYIYRKGSRLGILFGIPLFIFCGFQHCIANVITLGVARTFDLSLIICIAGNFLGSIAIWWLSTEVSLKNHNISDKITT